MPGRPLPYSGRPGNDLPHTTFHSCRPMILVHSVPASTPRTGRDRARYNPGSVSHIKRTVVRNLREHKRLTPDAHCPAHSRALVVLTALLETHRIARTSPRRESDRKTAPAQGRRQQPAQPLSYMIIQATVLVSESLMPSGAWPVPQGPSQPAGKTWPPGTVQPAGRTAGTPVTSGPAAHSPPLCILQ
jgi:hypothetical protein